MNRALSTAFLLALIGCGGADETPDDNVSVAGTAAEPAPAAEAAPYANRLWASTDAASAPGSLVAFFSDGTLMMDSCGEGYRLSRYEAVSDSLLRWTEDGVPVEAQILEASAGSLRLQMNLQGGPIEEAYRPAEVPFVCADTPR